MPYGNWTDAGISLVSGGAAGAVDQMIQNRDAKYERTQAAAGAPISLWSEYGTWFNYGVPVLSLVGIGTGYLKGNWATRLATIGGELAGRKITYKATHAAQSAPWRAVAQTPPPGAKPGYAEVY
jgi:hypothetical protein